MKKILLLTTGGTIASKETKNGLVPTLTSQELLKYIPQVENLCQIETLGLMSIDSTNMTPDKWSMIVAAIEERYEDYDGFVIAHGTDTMAYTAAALSYMIQNSEKPIVLTGAQKPIDNDITDAKMNLLNSIVYVLDEESQGVAIVFDGNVIAGTRGKKVRTKSYHAFSSVNYPYLAVMQDMRVIRYIPHVEYQEALQFYKHMNNGVFLLKLIPGMKEGMLEIVFHTYRCIIIESFGVGGIPEYLYKKLNKLMEIYSDRILIMTTQVPNEGSNLGVYQVGKRILKYDQAIQAYDMTIEAVVAKAMWILGQDIEDPHRVKQLFYRTIQYDIVQKPEL